MRISVVVPTYARPAAIARCARALQAQDVKGLEIVIVDDGSPEPPRDLPGGPHPVRVIRQDNAGPAAARNAGVAAARGELICLTDDDCRPDPGWAAAFARAAGGVRGLMAGRTVNGVAGNVFSQASQDIADHVARVAPGAQFVQSNNMAISREDYLQAGGFPESFRPAGEDRAFSHACVRLWGSIGSVEDALVRHDHVLGPTSFWRQHKVYGMGTHAWHRMARREGVGTFSAPGYYAGLVRAPLRDGVSAGRLARSALVALSQLATAQGYAQAAMAARWNGDPA